jgi:hypothetical protein
MRAILIKGENFETIGFEVKSNGTTIYSWGVCSELKSNWQKEIDVNDWMPQITKLIELKGELDAQSRAVNDFFHVAEENNLILPGEGIKCQFYADKEHQLKTRIQNIIKNIN